MRLSALQRHILRESYQSKSKLVPRSMFRSFYRKHSPSEDFSDSVTRSLERLIDKGLLIGFGRRTPQKWFIESVRLTPLGRKIGKQTLGQQQQLPLK